MDLRVFFIGSLWQGRGEKRVLRENFLKKMRKSKKKERTSEGGMRQTEGTRVAGEHHPYSEVEKSTCFVI